MLLLVIVTIVYLAIIIFDLRPLFKSKNTKAIWTYTSILTVSYIMQIMLVLGVKIPSPNIAITNLFKLFINTK